MEKSTVLKQMLQDKNTYLVPGVFECLGAIAAQRAGFEAVLVSGNAVSASSVGLPDMGLLSMKEVVDASSRIARSVEIPTIADADTGYGQPLNFMRTVNEFERGGIAGIHMEDQINPKKCAYYGGEHEIVPIEEYLNKLKAGVAAKETKDFVIIARTDAIVSYGVEQAVYRANKYLEAGADAAFVVGCKSMDDVEKVCKEVQGPVIINTNDNGALNHYSKKDFQDLGVKILLYPATLRLLALRQSFEAMKTLYEDGNTQAVYGRLSELSEFNEMLRLKEYTDIEYQYSSRS